MSRRASRAFSARNRSTSGRRSTNSATEPMPTILALSRTIKLAAGDYDWRCWIGDPPFAYEDYGNFVGNCGLDPLDDRYQFVDVGLGYM